MKPNSSKYDPFLIAFSLASLLGFLSLRRKLAGSKFLRPTSKKAFALITGASSGIGASFARKFAEQGYALVLVARREERLQALAGELRARYGVEIRSIVADLTLREDVSKVAQVVSTLPELEILVNNAGFGMGGNFVEQNAARQLEMIRLHDVASAAFTRAAVPGMIARRRGGIINVSSVVSFFPLRHNAVYSASKAFLNMFSEGVQDDIRGTGVYIQSLCPGFTHSEFHDNLPGCENIHRPAWLWMCADDVARISLEALGNGQVILVPGLLNKFLAWAFSVRLFSPLVRLGARLVLREGLMHR